MPKPTSVDLFAGAGGLSEGLRLAGFQTLVANDFDASAGASYVANHARHGTKFVLGDICSEETKNQIRAAIDGRDIDLVAGGPPCQAFSQVRNHDRRTLDPRNSLYLHLRAFVSEIRPKAFIMENVVGLQNLERGTIKAQILEDFALDGAYNVSAQILDSADYGVPQTRRRLLIIGTRKDVGAPPFPRILGLGSVLSPERRVSATGRVSYALPRHLGTVLEKLADPENLEFVTAEQALSDLEALRASPKLERRPSNDSIPYPGLPQSAYQRLMRSGSEHLFNADVPSIREDTVRRLKAIPQGGNFRDIPEELQARYLTGEKWGPDVGRDSLSRKHYYAYRKLHAQYFSWTLNTKTDCVYHYSKFRALSVREFARLHSFPDSYHFTNGDRHSRYAQIGNAVPPLLGKAIGLALLERLAQRPRAKRAKQQELRAAAE